MQGFVSTPEDIDLLNNMVAAAELARSVPFAVDLWEVQNLYFTILRSAYPEFKKKADRGDKSAREWLNQFASLGQGLSIRVG